MPETSSLAHNDGPIGVTRYSPRDIFGALMTGRLWPIAARREGGRSCRSFEIESGRHVDSFNDRTLIQRIAWKT